MYIFFPLQYSHLENPTGNGTWRATVHGVTESDTTEQSQAQAHIFPPTQHPFLKALKGTFWIRTSLLSWTSSIDSNFLPWGHPSRNLQISNFILHQSLILWVWHGFRSFHMSFKSLHHPYHFLCNHLKKFATYNRTSYRVLALSATRTSLLPDTLHFSNFIHEELVLQVQRYNLTLTTTELLRWSLSFLPTEIFLYSHFAN